MHQSASGVVYRRAKNNNSLPETSGCVHLGRMRGEASGHNWWNLTPRPDLEARPARAGTVSGTIVTANRSRANIPLPLRDPGSEVTRGIGLATALGEPQTAAPPRLSMGDVLPQVMVYSRPMWVFDRHTLDVLEVNQAAVDTYGYSRDQFLAMRIIDIRPSENEAPSLDDHRGVGLDLDEQRHQRKGRNLFVVEATVHSLDFAGRPALLAVAASVSVWSAASDILYLSKRDDRPLSPQIKKAILPTGSQNAVVRDPYSGQARQCGVKCQVVIDKSNSHTVVFEERLATARMPPTLVDNKHAGVVVNDMATRTWEAEPLRASEAFYRVLAEQESDLVVVLAPDTTIRYASLSSQRILGYAPQDILGRRMLELIHPDDIPDLREERVAPSMRSYTRRPLVEFRARHATGNWRDLEATVTNMLDDPAVHGIIVQAHDVTERILVEEELRYHSLHDALTDLPNRMLLADRLRQALRTAARAGGTLAVLLLDLDRFKEINDTFSHHHGDRVLQQVASRLRGAVRASDTVARLGGDEFALILPGQDRRGAEQGAQKIVAALNAPAEVEGHLVRVAASIGIAIAPLHGGEPETLLHRADVAMYVAKKASAGWAVYEAEDEANPPRRVCGGL